MAWRYFRFNWNDKADLYQCDEYGHEGKVIASIDYQRYALRFGHLSEMIVGQWLSDLTQDEFDRFVLSLKLEEL